MINEILFFLQIISVTFLVLASLTFGKEFLISLIVIFPITANLFVLKQINLFGFSVTCTDVFIVGSVLGLNLLQEYFGQDEAKKAIWVSFFAMGIYLLMSIFQISYIPNQFDTMNLNYFAILSFAPRVTIASIFVYFLVQRIECLIYGILKRKFDGKVLVLRNFISMFFTQFLDTVLFSFLGLYGVVGSISNVIFFSYLIKILIILTSVPFISFSKKILKKHESI